ncbi:LysR family transcriptional regulator [Notoacmeibacter marinus]|uniref:LysR family transcriptional regulator n=1 Tax=Notoacmeibacter marinus TaxID=1876515 RepID=A0A231V1S6_9HYPH|nr:LysR substrate-binding domain-containing protein [Notoacmeibacter marinus]OXT02149.1 LysR family transcriptional regulator [Notoacmeibacter marinus]
MHLDWIDDILAVIDTGSLARAAERRFLTQSAFTRRVRMIEDRIGTSLFDRSRKPVEVRPGVRALEPELREISARLRRLQQELRLSAEHGDRRIVFACQHALATTISPRIVAELTSMDGVSVRVRSGNNDECLLLLASGEADFIVTYESQGMADSGRTDSFEVVDLGIDRFVPVCATSLLAERDAPTIPVISYPGGIFFRAVFDHHIAPFLPERSSFVPKAETALTLAACEYALQGMGVAWLPFSLVRKHLADERLHQLDELPTHPLQIRMRRLTRPSGARTDEIWRRLESIGPLSPPL